MKSAMLTSRGIKGLSIQSERKPIRPKKWATVKLLASSINRVDLYMRDNGNGIKHSLPLILGVDGVGEVVEIGKSSNFQIGNRVILYPAEFCSVCKYCISGNQSMCTEIKILGENRNGTFAEYIAMPENSILPISTDVNINEAASLGVAYLTAWSMIFGSRPLQPGETILIHGAGGGVAYASIQLAKMIGANIIVTTSGEKKINHFKSLGIDVINYGSDDILKSVKSLTNGFGVDFVIDNVGEKTWPQSLRCLSNGGHLATCGATTGGHPSAEIHRLFVRQISISGSTLGSLEQFRRLISAFESGLFKPFIDRTYKLDQINDAFERMIHPERIGKIIIENNTFN